ncbi:MAG: Imm6 family immunity protein [Firmicutes bacterium]|nr:Imm6 family immunity protein [Bacillota bacterium]
MKDGQIANDMKDCRLKSKCIFAIKLAERACLYLQESSAKALLDEAIKDCWQWVHKEEISGEVLYDFLDNEENGFTLFQEMEEDEKSVSAWDCIIDAVAYIARAAYEKEGAKYLPEPVEIVDDGIFAHMVHSLILCDNLECEYIEKIYTECL